MEIVVLTIKRTIKQKSHVILLEMKTISSGFFSDLHLH